MAIEGNSIYSGPEKDEQAEEQWTRVNDKEWLLAEKHGFKNKDDYKQSLARVSARMKELEDINEKVNLLKEYLGERK